MTSSYRAGVASDFTPPREVRPVVGEVYAARVFVLDSTSCILTGLSYPQAILDGINVALCPNDTHDADAPGDDCRCGFWAYDQPKTWWVDPETESGVVPAVVELTGKAVVGERGIRAQKMRVVAVVLPGDISHADRQVFVANYPQVRLFASVKEMLTEFPLSDLVRPEETPEPKPRREFRPLLKGPSGRAWLSTWRPFRRRPHCCAVSGWSFCSVGTGPGSRAGRSLFSPQPQTPPSAECAPG